MTRSRKAPYYTDNGHKKFRKKIANHRVRHKDVPSGGLYKRFCEQWDICDYRFYCPNDSKAYRK